MPNVEMPNKEDRATGLFAQLSHRDKCEWLDGRGHDGEVARPLFF